jgi:hypothetical protein
MGESKTNFNNLLESKKEALDDIKFEIIEIKKKRQIILKQLNTIEKDFKSKNYSSNFQYKYGINKNEWNKNKDKMKNNVIWKRYEKFDNQLNKYDDILEKLQSQKIQISGQLRKLTIDDSPTPSKHIQNIKAIQKQRKYLENTFNNYRKNYKSPKFDYNDKIIQEIRFNQSIIENIEKGFYNTNCFEKLKNTFTEMIKRDKNIKLNKIFNNKTIVQNAFHKYVYVLIDLCIKILFGNLIEILEQTQISLTLIETFKSDNYKFLNQSEINSFHKQIKEAIQTNRLSIGLLTQKEKNSNLKNIVSKLLKDKLKKEKQVIFNISSFLLDNCAQNFLNKKRNNEDSVLKSTIFQLAVIAYKKKIGKLKKESTKQESAMDIWTIIENSVIDLYDIEKKLEIYIKSIVKIQAYTRGKQTRREINDSSSNDSDSSFDWNDPDINPSVRKAAIAFRDDAIKTLKKLKPKKGRRRKSSIKKFVNTIKKKMTRKGGKRKNKTKRKKRKRNIKY